MNCLQVLTALAPMAVVGEAPTWKGSGDVVDASVLRSKVPSSASAIATNAHTNEVIDVSITAVLLAIAEDTPQFIWREGSLTGMTRNDTVHAARS